MTSAFVTNYEDQLTEEVKQDFNHPSIIAWSMYNEIGNSSANGMLILNLSNFVKTLDPTRYTTADSNDLSTNDFANAGSVDNATDLVGVHPYNGWYGGTPTQDGPIVDSLHNANATRPLAITEYGAGASAYQYSNNFTLNSLPNQSSDHLHPQNYQTQLEEVAYAQFASRNYLWSIAMWNMFDFAISTRNEGDAQGQNDKGLVTRDRQTKKDSFYFYQANWNDPSRTWANIPVLYISDHTWTDRLSPSASMTVFSNLGAPTLWENGLQLGTMIPLVISGITIPHAYTMPSAITLAAGANNIQVQAAFNNQTYTNSVVWNYHAAALLGSTYARFDFTDTSADVQSGYQADTGQAFNGIYGWVNSTTGAASANTAGTFNRTTNTSAPFDQLKTRTAIMLADQSQLAVLASQRSLRRAYRLRRFEQSQRRQQYLRQRLSAARSRFHRFRRQRLRRVLCHRPSHGRQANRCRRQRLRQPVFVLHRHQRHRQHAPQRRRQQLPTRRPAATPSAVQRRCQRQPERLRSSSSSIKPPAKRSIPRTSPSATIRAATPPRSPSPVSPAESCQSAIIRRPLPPPA